MKGTWSFKRQPGLCMNVTGSKTSHGQDARSPAIRVWAGKRWQTGFKRRYPAQPVHVGRKIQAALPLNRIIWAWVQPEEQALRCGQAVDQMRRHDGPK